MITDELIAGGDLANPPEVSEASSEPSAHSRRMTSALLVLFLAPISRQPGRAENNGLRRRHTRRTAARQSLTRKGCTNAGG